MFYLLSIRSDREKRIDGSRVIVCVGCGLRLGLVLRCVFLEKVVWKVMCEFGFLGKICSKRYHRID